MFPQCTLWQNGKEVNGVIDELRKVANSLYLLSCKMLLLARNSEVKSRISNQ